MFTGLIFAVAKVTYINKLENSLRIHIDSPWSDITDGESIAVSGACLTVCSNDNNQLIFDISCETLSKTNFSELSVGSYVNLERSLTMADRLGGHWVSGHVDTTASILSLTRQDGYLHVIIGNFKDRAKPYLISKGCITVDGVNLTINAVDDEKISLTIIPHTLEHTTLDYLCIDQRVNIEFDNLAKIVAHQLVHLLPVNEVHS